MEQVRREPIARDMVGLENLGGTSYMNCILQCLSKTSCLTEFFLTNKYKDQINATNVLGSKGELAEAYAKLLLDMSGSVGPVNPKSFKKAFGNFNPKFEQYGKIDAHEFLQCLLDGLHEDLNRISNPPYLPPIEVEGNDESIAAESWRRFQLRNHSELIDRLYGQLRKQFTCIDCGKEWVAFEQFNNLSLPTRKVSGDQARANESSNLSIANIYDCLDKFIEREQLPELESVYCSQCNRLVAPIQKVDLWTTPDVLIIHLNRFSTGAAVSRTKDLSVIDFPIDAMDISRFVKCPGNVDAVYDLYAVSQHCGDANGGHYTAVCKSALDDSWFRVDDSHVQPRANSPVVDNLAYILFYERRQNNSIAQLQQTIPPVQSIVESQLLSLCTEEVQMLLEAIGFPKLKDKFLQHSIDGMKLANIKSADELAVFDIGEENISQFYPLLERAQNSGSEDVIVKVQAEYRQILAEREEAKNRDTMERKRLLAVEDQRSQPVVKRLHSLAGHTNWVRSLAVLADGLLAGGSGDNYIKVWDATIGACVVTLQGHTGAVYSLVGLRDGRLASGSGDHQIKLWNVASGRCVATLEGHYGSVWALVELPDGRLASGGGDHSIKLWDLASASCTTTLLGHKYWISSLVVLPDGRLASGSRDSYIKVWDIPTEQCIVTLQEQGDRDSSQDNMFTMRFGQDGDSPNKVLTLVVLPDGRLASGGGFQSISVWDLATGSRVVTLHGHKTWVNSLVVLPDGRLASSDANGFVKLWDVDDGRCVVTVQGQANSITALAVLTDGTLAGGSGDHTIKIWDVDCCNLIFK